MENKNAPAISVIMGVYNGEKFLEEAVRSVLSQTFEDFEFIICDDCSTDSSAQILKKFAESDNRIKLIKNEKNLGLAATLNRCIEAATGEFLARMDCDDCCLPERFAVQYDWMKANPDVCAAGSDIEFIDDNGTVYGRKNITADERFTLAETVLFCRMFHPSVIMRKDKVQSVGGYTSNELTTRAEDYDLWCKLCEKGETVGNIARVLFRYREDQNNITRRKYKYRVQEFRLKWYWIRRAKRPVAELRYAIKPLIVGLLPLGLYKKLRRKKNTK